MIPVTPGYVVGLPAVSMAASAPGAGVVLRSLTWFLPVPLGALEPVPLTPVGT